MKRLVIFFPVFLAAVVHAQTKFGVLVNGKMNLNTKINITKDLGVSYVRTAVLMQNWKGYDDRCDKQIAARLKMIMNVNWGPAGERFTIPFPTDTVEYKKLLNQILDKYKPEVVVVENEETIKKYHSGPIEDYINELTAAITVAHSKGLKITNGGLTNRELALLVYNDYVERGMKKEAQDFAKKCIKPSLLQNNPDVEQLMSNTRKLIEAYKRLPLDYVNIHIYEPIKNVVIGTDERVKEITPGAIQEIINYVSRTTGKKVMSNESGQRTSSPDVTTQMLREFAKAKIDYLIWFSGDGIGGAKALQNEDGSLRPSGEAFKNFMKEYNGK